MKSFYRLFVFLFLLVVIHPLTSYAGPPSIPGSGVTSYSQIVGLFGSGSCTGFLYSDGTCTAGGTGDVLGPASSTQYKIPLWGGTNKTLIDGVAVGTEGQILRSGGAGANPAWSAYTLAFPGAAGAVLYSDGTNWTRSTAPSLLALTLYGQSAGGGAQIALGSNSGSSDPNDGKILFRNATNTNAFTVQTGVSGAALSWTLPTAASGGDNYLLNVDADGTMGYTAPSTFLAATALDDTKGNGDTAYLWSADKIYDQLALKLGTTDKAADADKLDNHDSTYFQVDLGFVKGTMTDGKYCTYTASGTVLNCNSDGGTGAMATDTIWAAAGDLAYGTANDTGGILSIGTAYQVLHTNSGATAPAWTSTLGASGTKLTAGYFTTLYADVFSTTADDGDRVLLLPNNASRSPGAGEYSIYMDNGVPTFSVNGVEQPVKAWPSGTSAIIWNDGSGNPSTTAINQTAYYVYRAGSDGAVAWGALAQEHLPATLTYGGIILGDSTPDAAGEIGYDSNQLSIHDGTASRSLLQVASTTITKSEYMPIRYAEDDDSVTAPAAVAEIGTTTAVARSFAEDADNGVVFWWQIPLDYSAGIKFRVYFATDTNASADETAVFNLKGCAVGSSGALACTEGTGQESILELTTDEDTGELLISGWSAAITIDGTPTAGKMAKLLLIRDVTGGATEDDMAGHALVTGIEVKYQAKVNASGDY